VPRHDGDTYVATNDAGEHVVLARADLEALVGHRLEPTSSVYQALEARHFLFDGSSKAPLDLLALRVRSRVDRIADSTGLHMFVVTLRCEGSCQYCQVSRQNGASARFDMSAEHADRAVDIVFQSPSPNLKIELQGGEPLLAFPIIRRIVERARRANETHRRNLAFVIASTLHHLDDEVLAFCRAHAVDLSTSIDGPADLHDAQRPSAGGDSHRRTVDAVRRAREVLGQDCVAALMTTTRASLPRAEDIVDEYVRLEFDSIFLREQSPYGFAARGRAGRYDTDEWLTFYRRALARVIEVNTRGHRFREDHTNILLQKILSPMGTGYVDLQSPAGIGIAGIVYNYDGSVYASYPLRGPRP
jgi:His-Xaa-Ser system radical SAM maturase HxsB